MIPQLWLGHDLADSILKILPDPVGAARRAPLLILESPSYRLSGSFAEAAENLGFGVRRESLESGLSEEDLRSLLDGLSASDYAGLFLSPRLEPRFYDAVTEHTQLRRMNLDRMEPAGSPWSQAFLQLAHLNGWDAASATCLVLKSVPLSHIAERIADQLRQCGLTVELRDLEESPGNTGAYDVVWLCSRSPVELSRLHLSSRCVLVDSGRALGLAPCVSVADRRAFASRLRGFVPAEDGLSPIVRALRLVRLHAQEKTLSARIDRAIQGTKRRSAKMKL